MEECQDHVVADGEVMRSKKMDGVVERTRRCGSCGSLFKTFELTEDQQRRIYGEHDMEIRDLKRELDYYRDIVEKFQDYYRKANELSEVMKGQAMYGNKERE